MSLFSSLFGKSKPTETVKFETLRDDGVRAMQIGELPYAEKCLLTALELRHDLKAIGFLAEVYLRMQQYDKALPRLEELAASPEATTDVKLLLAETQGHLELWADQRATCRALLDEMPNDPRVLFLAAEADYGLDAPFEAIAHLTQSLALRDDYQAPRLLRARILSDMGQWNEVLQDAEKLLAADGENEVFIQLHAEALTALGKMEEATSNWEKLRAVNPFNQEAVLALGALYEQAAHWDKALALYDEAIDLQPDFAGAYKARGGVRHHLKDDLGAADDLKRSLELAPEKAAELDGEYTNVENQMNARYRSMNPYGF